MSYFPPAHPTWERCEPEAAGLDPAETAFEVYRAEFQNKRQPGTRRTGTSVGVDTYRPLNPTPEFVRMAG